LIGAMAKSASFSVLAELMAKQALDNAFQAIVEGDHPGWNTTVLYLDIVESKLRPTLGDPISLASLSLSLAQIEMPRVAARVASFVTSESTDAAVLNPNYPGVNFARLFQAGVDAYIVSSAPYRRKRWLRSVFESMAQACSASEISRLMLLAYRTAIST
jgi:hypothetical protein